MKRILKLKKDCQAFGTIIVKALTVDEAFQYHITSVSLFIATPDGDLLQSGKVSLRNFVINNLNATKNCIPEKASWLKDGLAAVQSLKSKDTFGEWIENLIRFITPNEVVECLLVGAVNYTYQKLSIKNSTQQRREENHSHRKI